MSFIATSDQLAVSQGSHYPLLGFDSYTCMSRRIQRSTLLISAAYDKDITKDTGEEMGGWGGEFHARLGYFLETSQELSEPFRDFYSGFITPT